MYTIIEKFILRKVNKNLQMCVFLFNKASIRIRMKSSKNTQLNI